MVTIVPDHHNFPREEEKILQLWKELDAFQTTLKQSKDRPRYTFYDGPPFATGLPHYGHILAGTIKAGLSGTVCVRVQLIPCVVLGCGDQVRAPKRIPRRETLRMGLPRTPGGVRD